MKQVYRYGLDGKYVEPVIIFPDENGTYTIPKDCTDKQLPQPNWKPIFQNGGWVETITEAELNALINESPELTPLEQNQKDIADLTFQLMMAGVLE